MKKVLFVATVVRLHINLFHLPYIKWFHDQGWQVDVAANNDFEDKSECVIPYCDHYYCLPFERSPFRTENLTTYRELKKLLDAEDYDLIHCHTPMGSVLTRLAAGKARKTGTKVIYTAHGFHFYKGAPLVNWLIYYPVERLLAHRTDLLITMNHEDYRIAQSFPAKRTAFVHGVGLDLTRFGRADDKERKQIRAGLGLSDTDIFAITVGNLIKRKNQSVLIQATARLKDPRFHLFVCGDGELEETLREEIRQFNLEKQVHLLGFRRDVPVLSSAADLFLFSSVQEGLTVSIMEAMASGLPVIASRVRGNTDLIIDGKGGVLVAPNDVGGFTEAIRSLMDDEVRRKKMIEYNRKRIRHYSSDAVMKEMEDLYRSMM